VTQKTSKPKPRLPATSKSVKVKRGQQLWRKCQNKTDVRS